MTKIFISYRREDSIDATGRLYDRLQAHFGRDGVFMDVDAIPFGVDFRHHLGEAVGRCDVLLAVIGDLWLEARHSAPTRQGQRRLDDPADFVRIELQSALTRGIPVIPVLVGRAAMPAEQDLPEGLKALAYRNAAEVRPGRDFHDHVGRLIRGIEYLVRQREEARQEVPTEPPKTEGPGPQATPKGVEGAEPVHDASDHVPAEPGPEDLLEKSLEEELPQVVPDRSPVPESPVARQPGPEPLPGESPPDIPGPTPHDETPSQQTHEPQPAAPGSAGPGRVEPVPLAGAPGTERPASTSAAEEVPREPAPAPDRRGPTPPEQEDQDEEEDEGKAPGGDESSGTVLVGAAFGCLAGGVGGWVARGLLGALLGGVGGWLVGGVAAVAFLRWKRPARAKALGHIRQGLAYAKRKQYDRALAAYQRALRCDPQSAGAHTALARLLAFCRDATVRDTAKALTHATRACELTGYRKAYPLRTLGSISGRAGRYGEAVQAFERAIECRPQDPESHNCLGWLYATCPDAAFRDGAKAVRHATRACDQSGWEEARILDTLAAAYAEAGTFEEAIRWQEKAVERAEDGRTADYNARLELYQARQPYREGMTPPEDEDEIE
ncbi:MAG: tetratricopeptide repeat protein [Planctomycetes bacterium]|nr:tetratricopeptide repeat protein [Planctomycetota bacterium]